MCSLFVFCTGLFVILRQKCCSPYKNIKGSTLDYFEIRCDSTNCSHLSKKFSKSQKKKKTTLPKSPINIAPY